MVTNPQFLKFTCSDMDKLTGFQVVVEQGGIQKRSVFYAVGEIGGIDAAGTVTLILQQKATVNLAPGTYSMKVAEVSSTDVGAFADAGPFVIGYIPNTPTNVVLS